MPAFLAPVIVSRHHGWRHQGQHEQSSEHGLRAVCRCVGLSLLHTPPSLVFSLPAPSFRPSLAPTLQRLDTASLLLRAVAVGYFCTAFTVSGNTGGLQLDFRENWWGGALFFGRSALCSSVWRSHSGGMVAGSRDVVELEEQELLAKNAFDKVSVLP